MKSRRFLAMLLTLAMLCGNISASIPALADDAGQSEMPSQVEEIAQPEEAEEEAIPPGGDARALPGSL